MSIEIKKPIDIPQAVWEGMNDAGKRNLAEWHELFKDAAYRAETAQYRLEAFFGLREDGARLIDNRRNAS